MAVERGTDAANISRRRGRLRYGQPRLMSALGGSVSDASAAPVTPTRERARLRPRRHERRVSAGRPPGATGRPAPSAGRAARSPRQVVQHAPAAGDDALAQLGDRLVVMGLRRVHESPRRPARPANPGARRTSWSALSKEPRARRWSVWPTSSGRCWISVPPRATLISCIPRQMPRTGRSRSSARSARAISARSRSGAGVGRLGMAAVAVGARVDVGAAGQDQAVEAVQDVVGVLGDPGVGRQHQRDRAGYLQRVDVGAGEQERLAVPDRPARALQRGAEADPGSASMRHPP